jgi:small-conductance mechanosensitive channel
MSQLIDRFGDVRATLPDTVEWMAQNSAQIFLAVCLSALAATGLLILKWIGRRLVRDKAKATLWRRTLGLALSKIRWWFISVVMVRVIVAFAHPPADIVSLASFIFIIASTLQAAIFIREVILGMIEQRAAGHHGLSNALGIIRVLVTFLVFAVAAILILSNLGVNVTGLLAGLGVGGIAIGLAAQGIFKDLFAALSIVLDRPFSIGDVIKFGDVTGRVETIGLKTTRIRSIDGEEVIVGNDRLLDQQLRNFHAIESRRIIISIPLDYTNEPERLAALPEQLKIAFATIPDCQIGHAFLAECREAAIILEVLTHAASGEAAVRDRVRHDVITRTLAALHNAGVQVLHQGQSAALNPISLRTSQ